ncbi:YveK family protein [Demequina sp. NBRC 110054]|uniref:YveK family protein n=1 Tax=Demequina sp. NBRC 110054 TaxID=1570343 RepID=UPI000A0024EA|nr:Wzz/FepE/Etk N-terminal domain-containing protein [Demequina sp. NBRC 110054]
MDFNDIRVAVIRGWMWIAAAIVVGGGAAVAYIAITPPLYSASAEVVLIANGPASISEAQQGVSMSVQLADTVAAIIDSPAVLASVSEDDDLSTADVTDMLTATARSLTSTIDITVWSSDPELAASVANAAAESAHEVIPELLGNEDDAGNLPLALEVIRPASVPGSPVSPNAKGVLVMGLGLGLCAGVAVAVALYAWRSRREGEDDGADDAATVDLAADEADTDDEGETDGDAADAPEPMDDAAPPGDEVADEAGGESGDGAEPDDDADADDTPDAAGASDEHEEPEEAESGEGAESPESLKPVAPAEPGSPDDPTPSAKEEPARPPRPARTATKARRASNPRKTQRRRRGSS